MSNHLYIYNNSNFRKVLLIYYYKLKEEKLEEEKISLKSKVSVSFADGMCATLNGLITGGGLSYFFTKYLGMDEGLASLVWILFAIWNAFNDPLFGYISDRTKSSLGRRIPYIRYGSILYSFIFIISWVKWPFGQSQGALFFQMFASLFLFDTFYTAIATSLYIMPYEMAISNKARSGIFIWKIIFSIISMGIPMVLFPLIKPEVGEDPSHFQLIMGCVGIFAFLIIFFSTFLYKEKGFNEDNKETPSLFKSIAACFKNRSFIIFEVISFTVIFCQTILMQGVIYYFDEFKVPMELCYGALVLGALGGIITFILKRNSWGNKKSILIMCAIFGSGCLAMTFFGNFIIISIIAFVCIGIGFSGGMYLIPLVNGDIIDFDESKTQTRREGMYAGVNSFITKPAISLANSAFLMILKWFGYNKNLKASLQNITAQKGILVAWMAIPALLLLISFISFKHYPLDGKAWNKVKSEIELKHNPI